MSSYFFRYSTLFSILPLFLLVCREETRFLLISNTFSLFLCGRELFFAISVLEMVLCFLQGKDLLVLLFLNWRTRSFPLRSNSCSLEEFQYLSTPFVFSDVEGAKKFTWKMVMSGKGRKIQLPPLKKPTNCLIFWKRNYQTERLKYLLRWNRVFYIQNMINSKEGFTMTTMMTTIPPRIIILEMGRISTFESLEGKTNEKL